LSCYQGIHKIVGRLDAITIGAIER